VDHGSLVPDPCAGLKKLSRVPGLPVGLSTASSVADSFAHEVNKEDEEEEIGYRRLPSCFLSCKSI
jgi:hypothetical protein